ncbi:RNA polymerase I-specific transcription initiation factor rrn11 [Dichotomopilus funicola]|uniref:RNA polymerase I-specific transcription initiation factor rrn11 n=1 Tax=Dichotomopilus funicola TaxID=1934379 RepID=A0AAN6ZPC0_9PEZI|nr:RNA polymerase I-specific transcription initiation factor rrn11 [Dichotomopilus funicola]
MNHPPQVHRGKRKRASSEAVINPLSHSPDTLRQFALAGYPIDRPLPSQAYPGFPHRAPRRTPVFRGPRHRRRRGPAVDSTGGRVKTEEGGGDGGAEEGRGEDADTESAAFVSDTDGGDTDGWQTATTAGTTTTDGETTDGDESQPRPRGRRPSQRDPDIDHRARAYRRRVGWLTAIVQRSLAEGDVATAGRAFGLLARARVYGRKVDLRWERYWEMGAEVLMREGELGNRAGVDDGGGVSEGGEEAGEQYEETEEVHANRLARLKAYYQYLIQQYPYSKQHASSASSALDFHIALYSTEMEAAHAAYARGLERLQREDASWEMGDDYEAGGTQADIDANMGVDMNTDEPLAHDHNDPHNRERSLRQNTLQTMTELAQRMDTTLETVPYSRDPELLRLRAMVSLFLSDLHMPPSQAADKSRTGGMGRGNERAKARGLLRRAKTLVEGAGGRFAEADERLLENLVEEEDDGDEGEDEDGNMHEGDQDTVEQDDEEGDEGYGDRSVLPMLSSMHM